MTKPIFLTVAFAAALTAFAAHAAERPDIPRTPLFSSQKTVAKKPPAPAQKAQKKAVARSSQKKPALRSKPGAQVIARTPLFPTKTAVAGARTADAKPARANGKTAQAGGKTVKASRKAGRHDPRKAKAGTGSATANRGAGKAKAATVKIASAKISVETIKTRTGSGYPVVAATGFGAYHGVIARYAAEYGVPATLAHAVISVESNYRPNTTGSAGEVGLMQIKPATARDMGYRGSVKALYDPETNIRFGMKYLAMAHKLGGGSLCGTILKYNAGHGASRMNPVSQAYCGKVQRLLGS